MAVVSEAVKSAVDAGSGGGEAKTNDTASSLVVDTGADGDSGGVNTPAETEGASAASEDKSDVDGKTDRDGSEEPKKQLAPKGSIASPVNIYRSPKDEDGEYNWLDKEPDDVPDPAENEETEQYAVVVRNIKSKSSRKKFEAHSIVVQSSWLKAALAEILKDYTGVSCELETLEFDAPFAPFVHRWAEFVAYAKREDLDATTAEHLGVLHEILTREIGDLIRAFEDYMRNGVVKFDHLWMIFQPGAVVVSALRGPMSAFELNETEYMSNQCGRFLRLRVDCVDTSGSGFGRFDEDINISEFLGVKKITGLNAFPLAFHENKEQLVASLVARGTVFERLAGHHFKQYNGTAVGWDQDGNEVAVYVTGRVVVDVKSFNKFSPYFYPRRHIAAWNPGDVERIAAYRRENGLLGKNRATDEAGNAVPRLPPHYRMLCRSRARGYSLKLKKWLDFFVQQISEIDFNSDAFERLVLPEDQKELILAFSESQLNVQCEDEDEDEDEDDEGGNGNGVATRAAAGAFDDVIAGKGRGIICLLSGPPGVGKTLTAEAVAESLRVPLHTLSSGDLGSSPWEVENGLGKILELVARWNAILLLDECDVFLEARSTHDLERNKVVSIFLRTLEYYQGILFMTTNRVANIDPAFQSRIHVSLEYPDLDASSRASIWRNFLGGVSADVSDAEVARLAELALNGRQIKNVVKTAQLLASRRNDVLRSAYIDTVLKIENKRPATAAQGAAKP